MQLIEQLFDHIAIYIAMIDLWFKVRKLFISREVKYIKLREEINKEENEQSIKTRIDGLEADLSIEISKSDRLDFEIDRAYRLCENRQRAFENLYVELVDEITTLGEKVNDLSIAVNKIRLDDKRQEKPE